MEHRIIKGAIGVLGAWLAFAGVDGRSLAAGAEVNRIDDVVVRVEAKHLPWTTGFRRTGSRVSGPRTQCLTP